MELKTGNTATQAPQPGRTATAAAWWRRPSLRWLTTFLVVMFPFATLFINRGDSYTLGLLTLIGVWAWIRCGARCRLNHDSAWLWAVFAMFFGVVLLSYVAGMQTDAGFRFLGRYLRFLLIVPVYLALRRYPPPVSAVFIGLAAGALVGGVLALLRFLHAHGAIRVAATTDLSIIFGDLAATMVLCTVAGFGLLAAGRRQWAVPLLMLCLAGGVAATLLSGTRGAWLAFLFLLLLLSTRLGGFLRGRYVALIAVVIVATFIVSYLVPRTATHSRLQMVGAQVHDYFAALHAFAPPADADPQRPRCLDTQTFLEAWVAAGRSVSAAPADVSVVQDRRLGDSVGSSFGCTAGYVLHIQNPDREDSVQYRLPRVPAKSDGAQQTQWLARGAGVVAFVGGSGSHVSIHAQSYALVNVVAKNAPGDRIDVVVAPEHSAWLVPLNGYYDEYSFAPADNNVGTRLEMWRAAWLLFLKHPVLGVGVGAYQMQTQELIRRHEIASVVGIYDHPHNDYFNMLASVGIVGLLALLALLMVPLVRFWRALRGKDTVAHVPGLAGALTVVGFAIYALTDTVFLHSMMITWFVIYLALFYALLDVRASGPSGSEFLKR